MNSAEIAKLAGVSRRSVTRVLNNPDSVHKKTREKILKVMEEHKYYPNVSARQLSSKKANILGLFIVQDRQKSRIHTDDMFFGPVIGSIINAAAVRGYRVITSIIDLSATEEVLRMYAERSIDGGIFISWGHIDQLVEAITAGGYFLAVFDQNSVELQDAEYPVTVINNVIASENAVTHLLELGHRKIATITGDMSIACSEERLEGYQKALSQYGVETPEAFIYHGDFTEESGEKAAQYWIKLGQARPSAIFAANDLMAIGLLRAFHQQGIIVPEDVSVIGFDDVLIARYSHPPLTTIRVPRVDMAFNLTDTLLNVIEDPQESKVGYSVQLKHDTALIVRSSCLKI
jgi:LacI family transcriptional regulator